VVAAAHGDEPIAKVLPAKDIDALAASLVVKVGVWLSSKQKFRTNLIKIILA